MKNLACEGDEAYLHMCEFDEWENEACFHDTDVHVTCDAPFDDTPSQGVYFLYTSYPYIKYKLNTVRFKKKNEMATVIDEELKAASKNSYVCL